ncbi:MAG: glycosyltransferase family 2 protein, partial [Thermoplasmata archaeon]|nr:glycosyltransferase family 2 protein [Thermoplasmata archaeon]
IEDVKKTNNWILTISLEDSDWDIGIHYSEVCINGFNFAMSYCEEIGIEWNYIGIVDGDMRLVKSYFEKLIEKFEENKKLGIASGGFYSLHDGKFKFEHVRIDLPIGGARLWRRECFLETPYLPTYSPDSVSNIKAKLRGWKTKVFNEVTAFQMRRTRSAKGLRTGATYQGRSSYYRGFTPIFALLKGLRLLTKYPFYPGLWYWFGYFSFLLKGMDKIDDEEIISYYSKTRMQEIKNLYFEKVKKFFKIGKNKESGS